MQRAAVRARATGKRVVVDELTTETEQTVALPTGGFALSGNPLPVRTKRGRTWTGVDTRLAVNADGTLSPRVTAYGRLTLSGGGPGPLATTTSGKSRLAMSWPGTLPAPKVSGASATYPEVLPGVDLTVTANESGGFSEVLTVKSAAAAADPALKSLTLPVATQGGKLRAAADGRLTMAGASGTTLAADAPLMWDSSTAPAGAVARGAKSSAGARAGGDRSSPAAPGSASHVRPIRVRMTGTALRLVPDAGMLAGRGVTFPVYIDPTLAWHPTTGGTPAFAEVKQGCPGVSFYGKTDAAGDYGRLGVGMNSWSGCLGIEHASYQWNLPHVIWGATINTATVNATEVYSASCSTTATVNLHWTGAIGAGTTWNRRPGNLNGFVTSASFGPSWNPTYCPNNGDVSGGFNVQPAIAKSASAHYGTFTATLTEDSAESSRNGLAFKRFSKNPTLQIFYNRPPNTPSAARMAARTGANNAGCATAAPYPYVGKSIATNTTVLSAVISDPDGDHLQAKFQYWIDGKPGNTPVAGADNIANNGTAKLNLPASFLSSLTSGQVVDWRVQVFDGGPTGSFWSPTCHFIAQPTAPSQPVITSADGLYPDSNPDTGNPTAFGAAAGTPGSFTFTNSGTTATKFAYRLDVPPALTGTPASQLVAATSNKATVKVTPMAPGPHTLWVAAFDAAGDASSMAAFSFTASPSPATTCASLAACYNNIAISADSSPGTGGADGSNSYSAGDLTAKGWLSGKSITINGATLPLPVFGTGAKDNVLAANQTITFNQAVPSTGATALTFLASSNNSPFKAPGATDPTAYGTPGAPYIPAGTQATGTYCFDSTDPSAYCPATGRITYSDGTSQVYNLVVPDWVNGPVAQSAVVFPHLNTQSTQVSRDLKIYPVSIPLLAGKTIVSVTLPDVSARAGDGASTLHIFSMATRNTTQGAPGGQTWTGAWANPSEDVFDNTGSPFSNQTFRINLKPSISGNSLRIKLDNALGITPLVISHVTVSDAADNEAMNPTGGFTDVTFNGNTGITLPAGGMMFSDPLPYTVTANASMLVSFHLSNSVPYLVQHSFSPAVEYITAAGSGDHTRDPNFSPDNCTCNWYTDVVTGLDVATSNVPTQAVLGDGYIDAWQPATQPWALTRLSDVLAAAEPTTPTPFGTINAGIESNQIIKDSPQYFEEEDRNVGGPSALSRIDRDILDQPGITTVVVDQGLQDILNGQDVNDLETNGYTQLLSYLYSNNINVIMYGATPCGGYTGSGASPNDPCTATVDANRTDLNGWLSSYPLAVNPWSSGVKSYYIDPDPVVGVQDSSLSPPQMRLHDAAHYSDTDKVNFSDAGYAALAGAYLAAQDTWSLADGAIDATAVVASDSAPASTNAYLIDNPAAGNSPATLSGGASWVTDDTRGATLALDGVSGAASTGAPTLDTSKGYSLSVWAKLTDTERDHPVVSQAGGQAQAFNLGFTRSCGCWAFTTSTSDQPGAAAVTAASGPAATAAAWTHLVATHDPTTGTNRLYVNGTLAATATGAPSWSSTGAFTIGNAGGTAWFAGRLSNLQAWTYALTEGQVSALYQGID